MVRFDLVAAAFCRKRSPSVVNLSSNKNFEERLVDRWRRLLTFQDQSVSLDCSADSPALPRRGQHHESDCQSNSLFDGVK